MADLEMCAVSIECNWRLGNQRMGTGGALKLAHAWKRHNYVFLRHALGFGEACLCFGGSVFTPTCPCNRLVLVKWPYLARISSSWRLHLAPAAQRCHLEPSRTWHTPPKDTIMSFLMMRSTCACLQVGRMFQKVIIMTF